MATPNFEISEEVKEMMQNDKPVKAWMDEVFKAETDRVKATGQMCLGLPIKNCGVVKRDVKIINRVEINSSTDFSKIAQILTSPVQKCPVKEGYSYVNVVLITNASIPMMIPYLFGDMEGNDLKNWMFVNNKSKEIEMSVNDFADV
eukprot:TRINITY_DN16712_c0_g2_i1.p1 TRINITY_DN16712_c0_g2~~TRINITY_DN16712_c0_g2_i1.p1  ORF type:complete len:146 (-),score=29.74 TRINITY_DN16712_c0_g2_i1:269-706(-)